MTISEKLAALCGHTLADVQVTIVEKSPQSLAEKVEFFGSRKFHAIDGDKAWPGSLQPRQVVVATYSPGWIVFASRAA